MKKYICTFPKYLDGCVHGHQCPTAQWSNSALGTPVSERLTQVRISNPLCTSERELTRSLQDKHTKDLLTPANTNTHIQANTRQPGGSYQLWDVSDVEGNLYETPVAPYTNVLTAIVVGVPQTN